MENKIRNVAVVILTLAVIILLIAVFILYKNLGKKDISASIENVWNISFTNLSDPIETGKAVVTVPAKLLETTTTLSFELDLEVPKDSVTYTFDVKNLSSMDAKVSAVNLTGIHSSLKEVIATLTYSDGEPVKIGDELNKETSRSFKLVIEFDKNTKRVPDKPIQLNVAASISYTQK